MFYLLFGNYLVQNNVLSQDEFSALKHQIKDSRLRLGLIAVTEGLLTTKQADEINRKQASTDKRFGDIAVDEGYLSSNDVTHLLNLQGNTYLKFIQLLMDRKDLTLDEINAQLRSYQTAHSYSDQQMEQLKTSDLSLVIPIILNITDPLYNNLINLTVRNLIRFIDPNVYIAGYQHVSEYTFKSLALQMVTGDHSIMLGISGDEASLLHLANTYAGEEFTEIDADSYDAICEFINCTNGLFSSELSVNKINVDMLPPNYFTNQTIKSNLFVVPVKFEDYTIDLIVSIDSPIEYV